MQAGMNNFKVSLVGGSLATSFLRVRWADNTNGAGLSADFLVNEAGMCATYQDVQAETISKQADGLGSGFDTALTLTAGDTLHFGVHSWGGITYYGAKVSSGNKHSSFKALHENYCTHASGHDL